MCQFYIQVSIGGITFCNYPASFWLVSYHLSINIEPAVVAVLGIFTTIFGMTPKFKVHGGSTRENIARQNIQVGWTVLTIWTVWTVYLNCLNCLNLNCLNCVLELFELELFEHNLAARVCSISLLELFERELIWFELCELWNEMFKL